jgi:hypothetical protein
METGYEERFPGVSHVSEDRAMHEALMQLRRAPASWRVSAAIGGEGAHGFAGLIRRPGASCL